MKENQQVSRITYTRNDNPRNLLDQPKVKYTKTTERQSEQEKVIASLTSREPLFKIGQTVSAADSPARLIVLKIGVSPNFQQYEYECCCNLSDSNRLIYDEDELTAHLFQQEK